MSATTTRKAGMFEVRRACGCGALDYRACGNVYANALPEGLNSDWKYASTLPVAACCCGQKFALDYTEQETTFTADGRIILGRDWTGQRA